MYTAPTWTLPTLRQNCHSMVRGMRETGPKARNHPIVLA